VTPVGPVDGRIVPRYAGPATFARLPGREAVPECGVAVVGVPFDSGVSYRPGARFGPAAIRQASKLLRPYDPALGAYPFHDQQVADAGDIVANPFNLEEAIRQIEAGATDLLERAGHLLVMGGDHTISLPLLRAVAARQGPVAVVHFDAHLDTWDTYFGERYTHGTPFRRASEEGLLLKDRSVHIGIRGSLYDRQDLVDDKNLGFTVISAEEYEEHGVGGVVERIRERLRDGPAYISVDIDVLDPAHAPGTGTPEAGGLTSRELLATLRALRDVRLVGADVMEVAPPYDAGEVTSVAACHVMFTLLSIFATQAQST